MRKLREIRGNCDFLEIEVTSGPIDLACSTLSPFATSVSRRAYTRIELNKSAIGQLRLPARAQTAVDAVFTHVRMRYHISRGAQLYRACAGRGIVDEDRLRKSPR